MNTLWARSGSTVRPYVRSYDAVTPSARAVRYPSGPTPSHGWSATIRRPTAHSSRRELTPPVRSVTDEPVRPDTRANAEPVTAAAAGSASRPIVCLLGGRVASTTTAPRPIASHAARVPVPIRAAVPSAVDSAAAHRHTVRSSPNVAATPIGSTRQSAAPRKEADPYGPPSRSVLLVVSISGCHLSISAYRPRASPAPTVQRTNRASRSGSARRDPATSAAQKRTQVPTPRWRSGVPVQA